MRHGFRVGLATAMVGIALTACGSSSSGAQSPQAYCKDFKPANEKVNADFEKLMGPKSSPADVKAAVDDMVAQTQKALDARPPTSIKGDIQTAHDDFVKLRTQLAGVNFDTSKLQGPPAIFQDPNFEKVGQDLDAYGSKYCGITPNNAGPPPGPAPQAPAPDTVAIQNFQFSTNTVPAGSKVVVKDLDQAPHSVTADDKAFDSGVLSSGQTGTFTAPAKPGTYPFHCSVHPDMHGTLTVS